MNKIEILAPCGSKEAIISAVRSGADAVYVGLQKFSARAFADNFDNESLRESISYCHLHGVKVHVAINTLVSDNEITEAVKSAVNAYLMGADAFIVQDWGLAELIKNACPCAEIHASTQMSIHSPEGVRCMKNLGFNRVVLAREMSRDEISQAVCCCNIDTEVFVHGALCMCVSGQCYMSAMLGGRSGNRGRCAQPCRLPFGVNENPAKNDSHALSLKDNSLIKRIPELEKMGVVSAKIEGRMKRPEYVAAAVRACRNPYDENLRNRLKSVFSRSGFTEGYYNADISKSMFGIRSKDDVTSATDKLLAEIRNEYKNEKQTNPVDFYLYVKTGTPSKLTASSRGVSVEVLGEVPQKAQKMALSVEKAESQLRKTGGTAFFAKKISVFSDADSVIPISEINRMRRTALELLTQKLGCTPQRDVVAVTIPAVREYHRSGDLKFRAVFENLNCLQNIPDRFSQCEFVFVPLFSDINIVESLSRKFNIGVKIPRVIFGIEDDVSARLTEFRNLGITDVYCGNIGTVALAKKLKMKIHGGFSLNVFNSCSIDFMQKMGLEDTEVSFELTAKQINALGGSLKRGVVGYGYQPLMITRADVMKNYKSVEKLIDRKGIEFAMMGEKGRYTEIFNSEPLMLCDKLNDFYNVDFMTLAFTHENISDCERIFNMYKNSAVPLGNFTRGLYYRGVM